MNGIACAIGSLPHTDPKKAVDFILNKFAGIPLWPQLPRRDYRENFYVQYSEGFPGVALDMEKDRIHLDTEKLDELADFYERIMADDLDSFAISEDFAAALYELLRTLPETPAPILKGHVTGGLSFALSVPDQNGKLLAYDENYFDVAVKGCLAKGLWQAKLLAPRTERLIVFFDEPSLVGFGSAFVQITETQVREALGHTVDRMHETGSEVGIHCCANTDWSLIMDSGTDILSFDAFSFFDHLLLYAKSLQGFIGRGGQIAFGVIPTDEKVFDLTPEALVAKLIDQVDRIAALGIDKDRIASQSLITPACGLGTTNEALAERALTLTAQTAQAFRTHFGLSAE